MPAACTASGSSLPRQQLLVATVFGLAPLLFASNMVEARWFSGTVSSVTLAAGRWLMAALVLLPVVRPARRVARRIALAGYPGRAKRLWHPGALLRWPGLPWPSPASGPLAASPAW
jgi:hypothetical protein